jgi:hypothetical protein
MKTITLLFLLMLTAAQADEWWVNGKHYKGTIHKFSADNSQVWVTSDWDNYGGSWLKVAELDAGTRVRLGVASEQEQMAVKTANEQAAAEAKAQAEQQAIYRAQLAAAQAQAQRDAQQADYNRRMLALREREVRAEERGANAMDRVSRTQVYIPPNTQGTYPQGQRRNGTTPVYVPQVRGPQITPVVPVITIYK